MDKETLRMHLHAGLITETEYKEGIEATNNPKPEGKDSLNENFVGTPMVGDIFDRTKADYEVAFEHYKDKSKVNEGETINENVELKKEIEAILYKYVDTINNASGIPVDDLDDAVEELVQFISSSNQ